jgi:hypothetical protein
VQPAARASLLPPFGDGEIVRLFERLAEGDVVAVGVLDAELAEAAGRIVDRVVDIGAARMQLGASPHDSPPSRDASAGARATGTA